MLTWTERVMLHNQFRILEILDPANATDYKQKQDIVGKGYEGLYATINENVSGEPTPPAVSDEVHGIFDMFRALGDSKKAAGYLPSSHHTEFAGFDGNNEPKHYAYAVFVLETLGHWPESKSMPRNSSMPMLPKYGRMVETWERHGRVFQLTSMQIEEIGEA